MMTLMRGEGLRAKALRGTSINIAGMVGSNALRLVSNLILTRLLFPEAFGLMALMQTFTAGLKMLSDTGVGPSIIRSDRGDDPDFLNTAWTVQIMRGMILCLLIIVLAWPMSVIYDEPLLMQMMPLSGLSVLISSLTPTKVATARRHMAFGRLTVINLATSAIGLVMTVILAWLLQSVWALVFGGILSSITSVLAQNLFLPGIRNRLLWNREAFREIFDFGKFIFLSSALGFIMNQGDKLVLGKYLSMADFGIYSIGSMLATVPFMLNRTINNSVVFPLNKKRPVGKSEANRRNVFRARRLVLGGSVAMLSVLAFIGVPLVEFLYDDRYRLAGPVVVLMCFALIPQMILTSYSVMFLAAGDSRSPFRLVSWGAILQIGLLFLAVQTLGTFGVILVPCAVHLLLMPLRLRLLKQHGGTDWVGDLVLNGAGFLLTGAACLYYWEDVSQLIN